MQTPDSIPRHFRRPGDDGYRTPTIEDVEKYCEFPFAEELLYVSESQCDMPITPVLDRLRSRASQYATGSRHIGHDASTTGMQLNERKSTNISESFYNCNNDVDSLPLDLPWKERIRHFTWAFFTLTMATGGLANVLYLIPYRFRGLDTIGSVVMLINIFLYFCIWGLLLTRFYYYPYTFKASITHPTESLYVPASIVSFGTILINLSQYGPPKAGEWLSTTMWILFWVNATLAVIFSAGIYLTIWSTQTFTIAQMTPIWIFPAYPMLIIGSHASVLSKSLSQRRSLDMIIGGTTIQGVGFLVSLTVYSAFIYRLMTQKLPKENLRPGMFVSVGPSAFTVAGLVGMANNTSRAFPPGFMGDGRLAADVIRIVANFTALWLWGLAIFFFFIAVFAHWSAVGRGRMIFSMTWYSFVFPNTALAAATFAIGNAFRSEAIKVVGCVMAVLLVVTYCFVTSMMVRAIILRHILWPRKGEDKDEGGFKMSEIQPAAPPTQGG
ncbi:TDT malic acid transporter [Histoplasma capsulatum]|uniref:TDT malic acid transporter n=1 Tax=Ajellomyces capsulatus TaxID=5037 RepID=A0A8A1MNP4_AJECA|nr:predicted protein [Histoplasma mississippiense (nom. inval.)]EDN11241.1 predicted protein [Histoplasma mississippiense (nom. inval.)]QSS66840.1 TDT malic acid transporter [Histoplasma capsulatum]